MSIKTCASCPSFTKAADAPVALGRACATDVCAAYGHMLGRPGQPEDALDNVRQAFALKCDRFGLPRPEKPFGISARVVTPDEKAVLASGEPGFRPANLATCRQCKNMVPSDVVANDLGYPLDLCRAKGTLIIRPQSDCKSCMYAVEGPNTRSTDGLELRPEYRDGYRVPIEFAVKATVSLANSDIDPASYPSDLPVTDEAKKQGIRAWRKVWNTSRTRFKFLPIFDVNYFDETERKLIPQAGDASHVELYIDYHGALYEFATEMFTLDEILCIQGMPGTGKTEFARWVAWLMQVPFRRFSFTSSTDVEDMIGKMELDPERGTYFHWGRIPQAWNRPGISVCDELNLAQNPVREALRSAFDNSKQLVLDQGRGEIVDRNAYQFFIIAQNPDWDMRNIGTQTVADADSNRLSVMEFDMPPEAIERQIIAARCKVDGYAIDNATLDVLMKVAHDLREFSKQNQVPFTWGLRQQIKVARKTAHYDDLKTAYRRAALDFYEPSVREKVFKVIDDYQVIKMA